jgi:acyl carrier protein
MCDRWSPALGIRRVYSPENKIPAGASRKSEKMIAPRQPWGCTGTTMPDDAEIRKKVFQAVAALLENKSPVSEDTPLIGDDRALDSMKLVELCLALEDVATGWGFEFDWTSEDAMSKSRSMFRTAGALATEFVSQMASKK